MNTILIKLRAVTKYTTLTNDNIKYYFVSDAKLVDSKFEFKLNSSSGEVFLVENLNRNISKFRELTLAARIETNNNFDQLISYEYLCITIATSTSFQPCFETKNVNN